MISKSVILIGDSIRMGYQAVVQQQLAGLADVWGPEMNGGDSRKVLNYLDDWVLIRRPDVVHLNCGLHDIKTPFGSDDCAIPLPQYRANLCEILTRIRRSAADIIWATTTPVNDAWHHANKDFDRFEADVDAYNAVAVAVAHEFEVPINDLHAVIVAAGRDALLLPDGVHFSEAGYTLLGETVAHAIRRYW
ncbi:MAG: SGNH/GDSL hydrolase family protein [Anaerolineae bacterium]|nr:SGNH/GDSL hydrolase family protein [Anaerolineae bacterium]